MTGFFTGPRIVPSDRFRVAVLYDDEPDRFITVRRDVIPAEAALVFFAYIQAAKMAGDAHSIKRIVIAANEDEEMTISMDWWRGQGIVYPPDEVLRKLYS